MAKKCPPKEFNPWPAFVDLFSSVILVLIFFILFIIVLLAYYMQFKFIETDANKVVVESKKFGQPIEGKVSKINKIPELVVPSKPKLKDMKISLEIGSAKENIKKQEEELGDYILIFFKKKSISIQQTEYERVKDFLKNKSGEIQIDISNPSFANRIILNKKKAMMRGININSYIKKIEKNIGSLTNTNFDIKTVKDIKIKEKITKTQEKYGFAKIYVKENK